MSSVGRPQIIPLRKSLRAWLPGILFFVDLGFIELDRLFLQGRLGERFSLESETSYPEWYQNGKELGLTLLAGACVARNRGSSRISLPMTHLSYTKRWGAG